MPAPNWSHLHHTYTLKRHAQAVLAAVRTSRFSRVAPSAAALVQPVAAAVDRYLDDWYRPAESMPLDQQNAERACMAAYLVGEAVQQLAAVYDEVLAGEKYDMWRLMFREWDWPLPGGNAK